MAESLLKGLETQQLYWAGPTAAGGREKKAEADIGDQLQARLITMPEDAWVRVEALVAEAVLQGLK